ncbi:hypothetical protein GCM10023178_66360 [Actinomadura luteofluorescens]
MTLFLLDEGPSPRSVDTLRPGSWVPGEGCVLGGAEAIIRRSGWLTAPLRAAISWIANRFGLDHAATRLLARALFTEVDTYFTDPARRRQARDAVTDTLTRARPRVVIAHSLGSVVTYEALWAAPTSPLTCSSPWGHRWRCRTSSTAGSHPTTAHQPNPPGVGQWINITDPGDIIAIPPAASPESSPT